MNYFTLVWAAIPATLLFLAVSQWKLSKDIRRLVAVMETAMVVNARLSKTLISLDSHFTAHREVMP